jgi:ParB family chromosome partitioning protein
MAKKPRTPATNLFTGGLLASAVPITRVEEAQGQITTETNDPLFANARMREITQQATSVTDASGFPWIEIAKLENNPYQPRRRMNQKRLEILSHEIGQYGFKGVLLARVHPSDNQRFQLVYGHRRREAAKMAGLDALPVMVDNTISDEEMKFLALNENILRDDLTPLDEAYIFTAMLEGTTQDAIAARLSVSRGYIRNRTDILKAPADVQDMVEEKPDTMKAVVYLKDVQEEDIRKTVIAALMSEEITINQIKAFIENLRKAKTPPVATPTRDEMPVVASHHQNGRDDQLQQKEANASQTVPPVATEKEVTGGPETTLIEQSKQQTESLTDKTKLETFIKYLHKYDQRLHNRQMTPDEKVALETLVSVARGILESC